jgi:hypothetical protein
VLQVDCDLGFLDQFTYHIFQGFFCVHIRHSLGEVSGFGVAEVSSNVREIFLVAMELKFSRLDVDKHVLRSFGFFFCFFLGFQELQGSIFT